MDKILLSLAFLLVLATSCTFDSLDDPQDDQLIKALNQISPTNSYDYYRFPQSDDFAAIPNQDFKNLVDADKVKLGQMLFHETGLAIGARHIVGDGTYSCASCHLASAGFTPGRVQGIADGGLGFGERRHLYQLYEEDEVDAQGVRPLSILNVAYVTNTLWSGAFGATGVNEDTEEFWHDNPVSEVNFLGFEGLESQNIEGLGLHRLEITDKVLDEYGYRAYFDACFPDVPEEDRYNEFTASFALGAYLRTVLANEAPFQKWLGGEKTALTTEQKKGALLFLGEARCFLCHNGPSFNAMTFHALGTKDLHEQSDVVNTSAEDPRNLGRGFFTGQEEDNYQFKVPQLYNLKDYSHYFHGSSKTSLREVIDYKLAARSENENIRDDQLSSNFRPVSLTEEEIEALIDFLENGLRDPNLERYVPEEVLSGNCFPNNDFFSRLDLGCE